MPKISVVMPVYNGEKYLREAIDSILNQTFTDFEFIIIDDGSTDNTEKIIKSYDDNRILCIKNEKNLGVADSLNRGLDMARGEYIARMDADDISLPERFEKQVRFLKKHKNVAVCGAETEVFGDVEPKVAYTVFGYKRVKVAMLFSSSLAHPIVMMRNSVIQKEHFRYNNDFDKVEDYDLWLRILEKYDIDNARGVLLKYRLHSAQVTKNYTNDHISKIYKLKKREIDRFQFAYSKDEFEAFCNYCLQCFNYENEIINLTSFFEKLYRANLEKKYYDKTELKKVMKSIIISYLLKLDNEIFADVHRVCSIVKKSDLTKSIVKARLKNTLRGVRI